MFDSYADIFNKRGDSYHAAMTRFPGARRREFELVVADAQIAESHVVADMPAGGGYLRRFVPAQRWTLVSVESSGVFFARCPEDAQSVRHHCPLNATPLKSDSVDRVVSLAGLHHVPDVDGFFREVRRVLKPGGRLCVADVAAGSAVSRFLDVFVNAHSTMGHKGDYLDERSVERITRAGLRIVRDHVERFTWEFANADEMVQFCTWMFGIDRATPAEVLKGIESNQGYEPAGGSGGRCRMNWELRFMACEKE